MKIAIICPLVPFPVTDGGRAAVFNPIKFLSQRGHHITLFCTTDKTNDDAIKTLSRYCRVIVTEHDKRIRAVDVVRSLFSATPYILKRFHSKIHLAKILDVLKEGFDVVQVEGIHSAYYGVEIKKQFGTPVVLRMVNLESTNLSTYAKQVSNILKKIYLKFEIAKLVAYKKRHGNYFDCAFAITKEDEERYRTIVPLAKTKVISGGVDLEYFTSNSIPELENSILWIGSLQWKPNQDSLWWFIRKIVPLITKKIPDIKISVVGTNPPLEISSIRHPNITIIGEVLDVRPYYQKTQVCVVPLRAGSGIRMKMLEMFAMKKAVVSTSLGCAGLDVVNRTHLLVADSALQFADAVIELLQNELLRKRCQLEAFSLVKNNYGWNSIADQFERALHDAIKQ